VYNLLELHAQYLPTTCSCTEKQAITSRKAACRPKNVKSCEPAVLFSAIRSRRRARACSSLDMETSRIRFLLSYATLLGMPGATGKLGIELLQRVLAIRINEGAMQEVEKVIRFDASPWCPPPCSCQNFFTSVQYCTASPPVLRYLPEGYAEWFCRTFRFWGKNPKIGYQMPMERREGMRTARLWCLVVTTGMVLGGASAQLGADPWYAEKGQASWYGKGFAGRPTATGETFSPKEMTAAHRTLPLGSKAMVTNLTTGEQTEVKINDRGPYADPRRRIIDLSRAAADSIGLVGRGIGRVQVTVTEPPTKSAHTDEDYVVQVGAFEKHEDAQRVLEQFQPRYPAVYIDPRDGPSGPYYRVRIGPFETEEKAAQVAKVLKQQGHAIFLDEVPDTTNADPLPSAAGKLR
jgi:rare lipoprotein A